MEFLSVEEAHVKTGQSCKLCNQQRMMCKDESLPVGYFKQEPQGGQPSFVISYRIKYCDHGLCKFHYKHKQKLFDTDAHYEEIKQKYCAMLRMLPVPARGR